MSRPARWPKAIASRQALHQAGDRDLVDHLGELARRRSAPSSVTALAIGHRHRLGASNAAASPPHITVSAPLIAPGCRPRPARRRSRGRARPRRRPARARPSAEAVVWSTKIAPALHAGEGAVVAERDRAQVVVVADAGEDDIGASAAASPAWRRATCRRTPATQLPRLGGGAVVDGDRVAGARQVAGHRIAHDAEAEEGDAARRDGS